MTNSKEKDLITKKKVKKIKSDIDLLFSGAKVAGYEINPFTLHDIEKLTPWFEDVALLFVKQNIDIKEAMGDPKKIFFMIIPHVASFLSLLLEEDIKTIKKLDLIRVQALVLKIIALNFEYLKNSLGLMIQLVIELTTKDED